MVAAVVAAAIGVRVVKLSLAKVKAAVLAVRMKGVMKNGRMGKREGGGAIRIERGRAIEREGMSVAMCK